MRSRTALWDISPPVHAGAPVFPGDTPYRQRWAATHRPRLPGQRQRDRPCRRTLGAHADAPLHYDAARRRRSAALDLEPYLGRCRVIHAIGCGR